MHISRILLGALVATTLVLTAGAGDSVAHKKKNMGAGDAVAQKKMMGAGDAADKKKMMGAGDAADKKKMMGAGDAADKKKMMVAAAPKKKKARCKDGQPTEVASYKLSKGENIDLQISTPLTAKAGNPKDGLKWMVHRRLGNCIACHVVSKILALAKPDDLASQAKYGFHGKIAPPLDGVNDRYTEGELRLIVVDAKKAFPDANTIMPAFHKNTGFTRVIKDCDGYAMMSAQQVEDIVSYLMTIK